jgi:hypothetical protein
LVSREEILQELRAIALCRVTDTLQVRQGQLHIEDIENLAAVSSIEESSAGLKVKFYDKLKALELLGKYLGLFSGEKEPSKEGGTLLQLLEATRGEVTEADLQEAEPETAPGYDLVELSGDDGTGCADL